MMNREVIYERTVTGSYMKIPAGIDAELDEKLMLKRKLMGALPVEKTYVDGCGQYWYNISGKQSLDTYCRVKEIGIGFVEKLAVSICSELDILEWNLMQKNCLMLDPELIFITNANQEFIFTLYPGSNAQVELEFQQLMEYLLTKINHRDEAAVRAAYGIYEMTLEEGYSIMDIRETIMKAKQREIAEEADRRLGEEAGENGWEHGAVRSASQARREAHIRVKRARDTGRKSDAESREICPGEHSAEKVTRRPHRWSKEEHRSKGGGREQKKGKGIGKAEKESVRVRLLTLIRKQLGFTDSGSSKVQDVKQRSFEKEIYAATDAISREEVRTAGNTNLVYPEEEIYVPEEEVHPTVYLGNMQGKPQGFLLYQGMERLEDIHLEEHTVRIGHGADADVRIDHETVSQMHARIDWDGENYYIEDLNSTNGTYVNDALLAYKEKRVLKVNDVVRFANHRYRFC